MRPLVLAYEEDPNVENIDDQYLFGSNILAAPILTEQNTRRVYLPEGEWLDFWTKEKYSGQQWIEYTADLDEMPLFIKNGSIIPTGPMMQYIGEKEFSPITLNIYHNHKEDYDYYDDNKQFSIKCNEQDELINIEISPTQQEFIIKLYTDKDISEVNIGEEKINFESKDKYISFKCKVKGAKTDITIG
jgi:alpha-glucosidase (family GH31 glycosyl hydrolase)